MRYFFLEPEVAGHIELSDIDRSGYLPVVNRLHYEFDGYLGGSIVESFPCFIVTEEAKKELQAMRATGMSFDDVETSTSDLFDEDTRVNRFRNLFG